MADEVKVIVPEKLTESEELDTLQAFARRIERQIVSANLKGQESMERLVCRLLTSKKTPMISAMMAHKWVEWRYGKAKETHEHKHDIKIHMTVEDADRIIRDYFGTANDRTLEVGPSN